MMLSSSLTMELFYHPLVLCFLILTFSFWLLALFQKTRKRLPPGPKGFPIIGNFLQIYQKPHESLAKLAKIHGPLMTLHLGSVTTIVASSSKMAKEILQNSNSDFSGRFITEGVTAQQDHNLSITWLPGGQQWVKLRKICTSELFTMRRLDELQEVRHKVVDNMMKVLENARDKGEEISIGRLTFGVILNMLSNTMYSDNMFDLNSNHVEEMRAHIDNIFDKIGTFNLSDFFPFLKPFNLQGIRTSAKVSYDHMHKCLDEIMDHRIMERDSGCSKREDFLDVLLDQCQEKGNYQLTHQDTKLILSEFFVAGTDTPSIIVEWAMSELLHNPNIMQNAKQEIAEKFGTCETIRENDMTKLPYLTAVLKETMRLHGPTPFLLPHYSETDVELSGYHIPKHTLILVNVWAISMDETFWDEPERFNPERFITSEFDFQGQNSCFIPFGAGRRICLGYNLAVRMMFLMLATFIHRIDWKLPDGITPENMNMQEKACPTLQKDEPLVAIPL